jgi:hypothetical protein
MELKIKRGVGKRENSCGQILLVKNMFLQVLPRFLPSGG